MTDGKLAGASTLIARRGKVAYLQCAGFADKESGKVMDADTIVRIYSMTKSVTTVAAMMLYEEGCFQLDDPVAKYLPEFADTPVWDGGDAPITAVRSAIADASKASNESYVGLNLWVYEYDAG